MNNLFLFLAVVLVLCSCGNEKYSSISGLENSNDRVNTREFHIDPGTTGTETEGQRFSSRYVKEIFTTHFEKKIDLGHLNAIARTSVLATFEYGKTSLGLNFYKMPCERYCPNTVLSTLTYAPAYLDRHWDELAGSDANSTVLGLYLAKDKQVEGIRMAEATILLNYSAQRQTIVHEMMHHLFQKLGPKEDYLNEQIEFASKEMESSLKEVEALQNYNSLSALIGWSHKLYLGMEDFLINYTLEEAVIERMMLERKEADKLSNIPGKNVLYGLDYAHRSLTTAEDILTELDKKFDGLTEVIDFIKSNITTTEYNKLKEEASFNKRKRKKFLAKISKFKDWAENRMVYYYYNRKGRQISKSLSIFEKDESTSIKKKEYHCSHSKKLIKVKIPQIKISL